MTTNPNIAEIDSVDALLAVAAALPDRDVQQTLRRTTQQINRLRGKITEAQRRHDEVARRRETIAAIDREIKQLQTRIRQLRAQRRSRSKPTGTYDAAGVRAWAREQGIDVPVRGRLSAELIAAYEDAIHN